MSRNWRSVRTSSQIFAALLLALFASRAWTADLVVQVTGANGKPVADAVVELHAVGRPTPVGRVGGPYVVNQKDIQFHPFVTIVPVGADVSFPNLDPVRHHVYSFSPAKRFELKLYAKDQTRSVRFDRAGLVAVGCNIHDAMSAFIYVADTAWAGRTEGPGRVTINVPPGTYKLAVWHPYSRAPGGRIERQIQVAAGGSREAVSVPLRAPPLHDMSAY